MLQHLCSQCGLAPVDDIDDICDNCRRELIAGWMQEIRARDLPPKPTRPVPRRDDNELPTRPPPPTPRLDDNELPMPPMPTRPPPNPQPPADQQLVPTVVEPSANANTLESPRAPHSHVLLSNQWITCRQCGRWRRLEACADGICDNCDDEDSEHDEYSEHDDADVYDEHNEYGDDNEDAGVYDVYDEDYNSNRDSVFTTALYNDDDVHNTSHRAARAPLERH